MKQEHIVKMQCKACKEINYFTRRNKKIVEKKLELNKFCSRCRKHNPHKEAKK